NMLTVRFFLQPSPEPPKWIKTFIHDAFFQRNNSVVRDLNAFGTNLRATLGDVAVTDPVSVPQFLNAILSIEWMHLQSGDMNQKARADKFFVHPVIAQNVADILAQKTFDAFPEFLHTIDVLLLIELHLFFERHIAQTAHTH